MLGKLLRRRARYTPPENLTARDPALIAADVEHAVATARFHLAHLPQWGVALDGAAILEIGPGPNFGAQLILASHGARVAVADRFLARWNDAFHPAYYRALLARWDGPNDAIRRVLREGGYAPEAIVTVAEPAERMPSVAAVDAVLSNAVLEHVSDFAAVCRELFRVTKPGGINTHQVDFRDHHDFARPLDFLAVQDADFAREFEEAAGRFGNRVRPSEARAMFRDAGFDILAEDVNARADPAYLARILPRIRRSRSRYRDWPEADLRDVGIRFVLRRP